MPAQSPSTVGYAEETVVSSAARTAAGDTGVIDGYGGASSLRAQLDVTAATGTTPSLTVLVEDTLDGTNWNTVGSFSAKTATGREVINVTGVFADRIRVSWSITGTGPSFTFAVIVASQSPLN